MSKGEKEERDSFYVNQIQFDTIRDRNRMLSLDHNLFIQR